jgi:hypothetical protein
LVLQESIAVKEYNEATVKAIEEQVAIINRYTQPMFQILNKLYPFNNFGTYDPIMYALLFDPVIKQLELNEIKPDVLTQLICAEMKRITEVSGWNYIPYAKTVWLKDHPDSHQQICQYLDFLGLQPKVKQTTESKQSAITVSNVSLALLRRFPCFNFGRYRLKPPASSAAHLPTQPEGPGAATPSSEPSAQSYQPVFAPAQPKAFTQTKNPVTSSPGP